ncbi:MAG: ferritin [Desulfomonile tiedjei]|nr:ferritin [Desulfomonile tiedjei]
MISDKIQQAFNEQINRELYSAYLYLSMAAYFESINLKGFANWMKCQVQEEMLHAMKFYNFVNERNGTVVLAALEAPPTRWDSPIVAFEDANSHERKVTSMINNLVDLAIEERDHASNAFLQWFVTEQVEEEASTEEVVHKLKLAGHDGSGLFMIDQELAARVFTMPAAPSGE